MGSFTELVVASDLGFVPQLAVVLASLSLTQTSPTRVFVFHERFPAGIRKQLASVAPSVAIEWIDATSTVYDGARLPKYLPPSTLYRLRMEELLPGDVDRVLYLDADTVVCRPLDELWRADLGDALVGAVRDPSTPFVSSVKLFPWRGLGAPADRPYFNAGLMVVPLDRWRAAGLSERALELLRRQDLAYADQCALNAVTEGSWRQLVPRWNLQSGHVVDDGSLVFVVESESDVIAAREDPAVVHYNSSPLGRPWLAHCRHPFADRWLDTLDRTPWAGTLPPRWSRPQRALQRLRKALGVVLHG